MRNFVFILFVSLVLVGCANGRTYNSVDAEKFAEVVVDRDVQIIDTRTPEEFAEGHIPGAVNIDLDRADFDEQICRLDENRPVAVYCRGGRRSKIAAERIVERGYDVTELQGGLITWEGEIEK